MQILILSQFYLPEQCAASNRVVAMAEHLAADAHDVTVVTGFPSFPSGRIDPAYAGSWGAFEAINGVKIFRVWTYASPRRRGADRLLNWLSVAAGATVHVLDPRRHFDLVIVTTPPITLALPALAGRYLRGAVLVTDVRDVFPEIAIQMGEWKRDGMMARIVGFVADCLYRSSRSIVTVTESARNEVIARGIAPPNVCVAPNGFDPVKLGEPAYRRSEGEIVVAYVGNIGLATGLEVLIEAAARLSSDPRFTFVLIGDGADAGRIRDLVRRDHLTNVKMLGVVPRSEAIGTLREADICVVPLRGNIRDSIPTKLFDALSVGCPVVLSAEGEAVKIVEESGSGIVVPPADGHALADAIRTLADDPERRRTCGALGRAYVYEHYDRAKVMADLSLRLLALRGSEVSFG